MANSISQTYLTVESLSCNKLIFLKKEHLEAQNFVKFILGNAILRQLPSLFLLSSSGAGIWLMLQF